MVGDILGAIIGPVTEAGSAAAQYQASKHERNISWKRQQQWELISPSLRVEGLRRAGLNPLLAASSGFGGPATNVATADPGSGGVNMPANPVGEVISNIQQRKLMDTEIEMRKEQMFEQKARRKMAEREELFQSEFGHETARANSLAALETALNLMAERGLTTSRMQEVDQAKMRIMTDRLLMEMGIPGARAMEELYQKYPFLRQFREFSGGGLGGAAIGATGATAGYLLRGGDRTGRHPNEDFGKLVPGKPKRRK